MSRAWRSAPARPHIVSPAIGLQIVDMDVAALLHVGLEAPDVLAVFHRRITRRNVAERDLVADRNVVIGGQAERG